MPVSVSRPASIADRYIDASTPLPPYAMQSQEEGSKSLFECVINQFSSGLYYHRGVMGSDPCVGNVRAPEEDLECVYEDVGLVSFGGVGVPAEEVTVAPPSPTVLEFLNHSAGMELNATDFEDPFAFDATTLSKDDLHLRLYVPHRSLQ
jgi:hypothetical protein